MDKYLIFSDIDGTLTKNNQQITETTKKSIIKLIGQGHLFYVATGRKYGSGAYISDMIHPDCQIVASNGCIFDLEESIQEYQLSKVVLEKILEVNQFFDLSLFFFGKHTTYYTHDLPTHFKQEERARLTVLKEDFIKIKGNKDRSGCISVLTTKAESEHIQ